MLKSVATALVGIVIGVLATAELGVSPSAAQQLRRSIPCQPIGREWTRCKAGRLQMCRRNFIRLGLTDRCLWLDECRMTNSRC